jgi:putative transposase
VRRFSRNSERAIHSFCACLRTFNPPKLSRPSQSWRTFLKNQADAIWMCDFCVPHTVRFKALYILVIMELQSRKVVHVTVTGQPTLAWVRQQVRNATYDREPKSLTQ